MRRISKVIAISALAFTLTGGFADAQDHRDDPHAQDHRDNRRNSNRPEDHHYVRHDDWKKGQHMRHEDWDRGRQVDYRQYHLRRPSRGYEWREVDGNYVLAAVATGIIISTVVASQAH